MAIAGVVANFFNNPQAGALLNSVAFGPMFGPHIAFGGGVAAAAYAATKLSDFNAKDIVTPLAKYNRFDVLLVGGIFGAIGYLLNEFFASMKLMTDTVALTVLTSNMIARAVILREGPFGSLPDEIKERGFFTRLVQNEKCAWLPWQKDFIQLIILGLGFGLPAGVLGIHTGQPVLAFGIAAFYLIFLTINPGFPVVHHIMLPAALAAALSNNYLIGGLFGVLGALIGELAARLFYNYGKSHIDPPAVTIAILTTIILALF